MAKTVQSSNPAVGRCRLQDSTSISVDDASGCVMTQSLKLPCSPVAATLLSDAERAGTMGVQPASSMPVLGRKSMPHMNAAAATAAVAGSSGAEPPASAAAAAADAGAASRTTSQGSEAAGFNRSISAGAALGNAAAAAAADDKGLEGHASGDEAEVEGFAGDDEGFDFDEPEVMHRLCPSYASDINSPLRWVCKWVRFLCLQQHVTWGRRKLSCKPFTTGPQSTV